MKGLLNYFSYVPKMSALFVAGILAVGTTMFTAAAADVFMEGDITVKNVTNNATVYTESTTAGDNDTVRFKIWYHNTELASSDLVAENVRVKIDMPTSAAGSQTVAVTIDGDNTNTVYDSTTIYLDEVGQLEYIPGTAKWLHNVGDRTNIQLQMEDLSDNIVTGGAFVVLEDQQPCYEYEAWVYFDAKIVVEDEPEPIYACDTLNAITVDRNTRQLRATATAANGAYVSNYEFAFGDGATEKVNTNQLEATTGEHTYAPGTYTAMVTVNFAIGDATSAPTQSDTCQTTVTVEEEPDAPIYECSLLTLTPSSIKVNEQTTAKTTIVADNGASLKQISFDWGDSSDKTITDQLEATHTYTKLGNYTVDATVTFNVNGEEKTDVCSAKLSVSEEPQTPPTEELPNTGVAGAAAGFFGTGALGLSIRSWIDSKRMLRAGLTKKDQ